MRSLYVGLIGLALVTASSMAQAKIAITVDKDAQQLTVVQDGVEKYRWPVSSGLPAYETPNGSFQTFRLEEDHYSKEFDEAPMPNSVFFTKRGHAIHGTDSVSRLGTPASHGCVRLSRENAATLFAMVKADGVLNTISNKEIEGRFEIDHAAVATPLGALTGNWGLQASNRKLGTQGTLGGLLAPTNTDAVAGFVFEQLQLSETLRLQAAGRIESITVSGLAPVFPANFLPPPDSFSQSAAARDFAPKSFSVGLLKNLPWDMVASLSAQRAQRAPAAPELFSRGSDGASGTFVIGNPDLKLETAESLELGLKRITGPFRFEASLYATRYRDFIYKQVTGNFCTDAFASCGASGPLLQVAYGQRDANFRGAELAAQYDIAPLGDGTFGIDGQFDVVRATFADGSNVPRIAPMRLGGGVWWRSAAWQTRIGLLHAFTQNDIALNETSTAGYNLLKVELSHTHIFTKTDSGLREMTFGVVGDNLLDERIRNHISFKKAEVLQPGLGVRLFTSLRF